MTEPTPKKRFRFSLGFLLAWVLLTGFFMKYSMDTSSSGGMSIRIVDYKDGHSKRETKRYINYGWPFHALTFHNDTSLGSSNSQHSNEIVATGLALNFVIGALGAFLICGLASLLFKRFSGGSSVPLAVKND